MNMAATFSVLAGTTIVFIWLLLSYVNSLANQKPHTDATPNNQYAHLLDTRWPVPLLNFNVVFPKSGQ